jgi:hypothetical protein
MHIYIGLSAITEFTCSSVEALETIVNTSEDSKTMLFKWLSLLNGKLNVQCATLHAIARIFDMSYEHHSDSEELSDSKLSSYIDIVNDKKKIIFENIGKVKQQLTLTYLLKLVRGPVSELRYAAVDVLRATAGVRSNWGLLTFASSPEFRAYVLNQESEYCKEGREWKYSLVQTLSKHPNVSLLGQDEANLLLKISLQGAHHIVSKLAEPLTIDR